MSLINERWNKTSDLIVECIYGVSTLFIGVVIVYFAEYITAFSFVQHVLSVIAGIPFFVSWMVTNLMRFSQDISLILSMIGLISIVGHLTSLGNGWTILTLSSFISVAVFVALHGLALMQLRGKIAGDLVHKRRMEHLNSLTILFLRVVGFELTWRQKQLFTEVAVFTIIWMHTTISSSPMTLSPNTDFVMYCVSAMSFLIFVMVTETLAVPGLALFWFFWVLWGVTLLFMHFFWVVYSAIHQYMCVVDLYFRRSRSSHKSISF